MIKSKNTSKIKIALAIPFAVVVFFFFANSVDIAKASGKILNENTISPQDTIKEEIVKITKEENPNGEVKEYSEDEVFYIVEDMPKFQGEDDSAFRIFIGENLKYPETAQKNEISGSVYVQFDINKKGELVNAKVIRSADSSLNMEALRVVNSSPNWEPGTQRGKPVIVRYTFPISFALQ